MSSLGLFPEGVARDQWIAACQFHPLSDDEVLRKVVDRVRTGDEGRPVVLLDLDSTLYEVQPRTEQILREWLKAPESEAYPSLRRLLESLRSEHVGYGLRETFQALGAALTELEHREGLAAAQKFWGRRFFTSDYLTHDEVYPGASEFARELYAAGAELVYLTGRDEPGMGRGTRDRLRQDGFPLNVERTHLLLKKSFELDDLAHKQSAAEYINARGSLVASLENEPVNLVALHDLFPKAMHVFVETTCSERPAPPRQGLYRIRSFGAGRPSSAP